MVTSRFELLGGRYGDLAYSLLLKEVGALLQTFYLVAQDVGLGGCALGGGTPDTLLSELVGTAQLQEPVVGEFMIGPLSESPSVPPSRVVAGGDSLER